MGNTYLLYFLLWFYHAVRRVVKNLCHLKSAWGAEPKSIDPQFAEDVLGFNIIVQMFSGIMDVDAQTGGYKAGLAKSWDISADGLVYTFHLTEGLVWSDGVSITAEGIRKSYLRILDKETFAHFVSMLKSTIKNADAYFEGKGIRNRTWY